jgi:hypothetical protein
MPALKGSTKCCALGGAVIIGGALLSVVTSAVAQEPRLYRFDFDRKIT